ncbi:MAG: adenylate/guanylate cyclase domain-containing protein, partial [Ilumatobacter sp.]|nr:adenylate/guanylate cyclase domain-containing protein [Ilumatobacter sp.]
MVSRPTGTVAFLFTDVVGSTRLWEQHDAEMEAALEIHDALLRSAIEEAGGYVFSTAGDAFSAAFETCDRAAHAARAIQARCARQRWPTPTPIAVRIGLHIGRAQERDGDYFGPVLNRTARLMAVAHGGQIVTSHAIRSLLDDDDVVDLGEHRLKDLGSPEHVWQLGGGSFPPLRSLDTVRHNLPIERTPLVGRDAELDRLVELVTKSRLVTILGIGGTGKTRVAAATAAQVADQFDAGVWFVDLVPVVDRPGIAAAIAGALGIQLPGHELVSALGDALDGRDTLIVLDNCEHVTDAVADVAELLLDRTSTVRLLATAREPLELVDEVQFHLEPLAVDGDSVSPAAELFIETAGRVGYAPADDDLPTIAAICAHLDGHPLSIELAAAQLRQLTLDQLAERLDQRFELLGRSRGGRQASLLAVLDDTWEMLDDPERDMLLQLAAFPSTFDLEAAEGVCADLAVGLPSRTLGGLVDRSVVTPTAAGRYRLLETIKLFARRRWNGDAALHRHEAWLLESLRRRPPADRFVSIELSAWIGRNWDDWRAIEDRLAGGRRWADLAELLLLSHIRLPFTLGPTAMALLQRIEGYIERLPVAADRERAVLNLSAAHLGLPARRPDWIERGSTAALEFFDDRSGCEHTMAAVIASWPISLRRPDEAVAMLDAAFEHAEAVGEPTIADVALGYQANHLALGRRRSEAFQKMEVLEARLETRRHDYTELVFRLLQLSLNVVGDPPTASAAARQLEDVDYPLPILLAAGVAADGDFEEAARHWTTTLDRIDVVFADDGLPDLLIVPAVAAHAVGDHDRCRTLVTAIRRSTRPTQNFLVTLMYRELRDAVGLDEPN